MEYKWYDDVPANFSVEQGDIVEQLFPDGTVKKVDLESGNIVS